jgi:uncharacterized protein (TIGR02145 family)
MVGILSGAISLTTLNAISNTVFAKNVDYKVNLESSLVVTVPTNTVVLDINPATSAFSSKDLGVTVGTNNPTGYTLTMSADSTVLTKTTGTAAVIPTLEELSGGYTESNFTVNHWGYKLPTTNYLPFSTSIELDTADGPTNGRTSTITFGAKANVEQPAGAYELEINFAAVANYSPPIDYCANASYDCMQEIVASDCTTVAKRVIDRRDGNMYSIQRLADGNCWMLDNLSLDLVETDIAILRGNTNASDLALSYLKGESKRDIETEPNGNYATTGVAYWTTKSNNLNSSPLILTSGNCYSADACANYPSEKAWNKNSIITSYGIGSGAIGVYYNFCAASAGSYCYCDGDSECISKGDASEDICPSGWRMPTGGANTVAIDGKGELSALLAAYNGNQTAIDPGSFQYNLSTPFSGFIALGTAYAQGNHGSLWSSTRYTNTNMYYARVHSVSAFIQVNDGRYYGNSVRCLLR